MKGGGTGSVCPASVGLPRAYPWLAWAGPFTYDIGPVSGAFGRRSLLGVRTVQIYEASVSFVVRALVVSAQWAARCHRQRAHGQPSDSGIKHSAGDRR
jgi:hypothetical protein